MLNIWPRNFSEPHSTPVARNSFNDDILNDKRVSRVLKGVKRYVTSLYRDAEHGDWETFCRATALMGRFYSSNGSQTSYRESILRAAEICATLKPGDGFKDAENRSDGIVTLDGLIIVPGLIAWCAVVWVKGGYDFSMKKFWESDFFYDFIIEKCCKSFDNLTDDTYNDYDIALWTMNQNIITNKQ